MGKGGGTLDAAPAAQRGAAARRTCRCILRAPLTPPPLAHHQSTPAGPCNRPLARAAGKPLFGSLIAPLRKGAPRTPLVPLAPAPPPTWPQASRCLAPSSRCCTRAPPCWVSSTSRCCASAGSAPRARGRRSTARRCGRGRAAAWGAPTCTPPHRTCSAAQTRWGRGVGGGRAYVCQQGVCGEGIRGWGFVCVRGGSGCPGHASHAAHPEGRAPPPGPCQRMPRATRMHKHLGSPAHNVRCPTPAPRHAT